MTDHTGVSVKRVVGLKSELFEMEDVRKPRFEHNNNINIVTRKLWMGSRSLSEKPVLGQEPHRATTGRDDCPTHSTARPSLECASEPARVCEKTQKPRVSESVSNANAGPETHLKNHCHGK